LVEKENLFFKNFAILNQINNLKAAEEFAIDTLIPKSGKPRSKKS